MFRLHRHGWFIAKCTMLGKTGVISELQTITTHTEAALRAKVGTPACDPALNEAEEQRQSKQQGAGDVAIHMTSTQLISRAPCHNHLHIQLSAYNKLNESRSCIVIGEVIMVC